MPEDKEYLPPSQRGEHMEESMGLSQKTNELEKEIDDIKAGQKQPMESLLASIDSLGNMFKFPLGCKVRNRHNEDGYVELCGVDYRGIIYLVNMPENHSRWYTEFELTKVNFNRSGVMGEEKDSKIKTDIKPNEKTSDFSPELA